MIHPGCPSSPSEAKRGLKNDFGTPFDRALETRALLEAAHASAARRGEPGSASYRTAWFTFRARIQSIDDLKRWRAAAAGGQRGARNQGPPKQGTTPSRPAQGKSTYPGDVRDGRDGDGRRSTVTRRSMVTQG